MPAPYAIRCEQLFKLLGTAKSPDILDVRPKSSRHDDPRRVASSRIVSEDLLSATNLQGITDGVTGPAVVVCDAVHARSQSVAAWLRQAGIQAEHLEDGRAAWVAAGLPLYDPTPLRLDGTGRSIWVTRSRPKINRIACPWLIRRFVDPRAVFLYVLPAEVEAVAQAVGAMPYDIEGVFGSHRAGDCTFDSMIREFGLNIPALDRLATIVRGADTDALDLAPECAGLLAASLGLSRMYSDDVAQLDAGMSLYDAFYRWSRDATTKRHSWENLGGPSR